MAETAATQAAVELSDGPAQSCWAIFVSCLQIVPTPIWAAILSVTAIITAAVFGARWQRKIARETLTFNTIEHQLWDKDYIDARKLFIKARDTMTPVELTELSKQASVTNENAAAVRAILNNYEVMSLGMLTGVLDEKLYKKYFRGTFLADYEGAKFFIQGVQAKNPKAYKEYGTLYERWRSDGQ